MCCITEITACAYEATAANTLKRSLVAETRSEARPLKRSRPSAEKSVRFAQCNQVYTRDVVTPEESRATWNQDQDYVDIKARFAMTVQTIKKVGGDDSLLDQEEHCMRGLESGVFPHIAVMRVDWIRSTVGSVLKAQRIQRTLGFSDPEQLGAVSRHCSSAAQRCAQAIAQSDAQDRC